MARGVKLTDMDVKCGGVLVVSVKEFKYLSALITVGNEEEVEVWLRIAAGTRCSRALNKLLSNK